MKKHVKNYFKHHGFGIDDTLTCEICGRHAADIHHIEPKGMGGSKRLDGVDNLIALCRNCHELAHRNEMSKDYLRRCKK